MQNRGLNNKELSEKTGISRSNISMILSGKSSAGWDSCARISEAFSIDPMAVFQIAGLLPETPDKPHSTGDPVISEIMALLDNMTPERRQNVLEYVSFLYQRDKDE